MDETYYFDGLRRQASALYARQYLGIQDANGFNLLTDFNSSVVSAGYFVNRTPLWNDLRIPLASTRPSAASAPVASILRGGVFAYRWDNAGGIRSLEWEMQTPHGFNEDPSLGFRMHLHWTCGTDMTGLGVVEWNIEVSVANLNDVFPVATNTYSATAATTAAFQHIFTPLHTFTTLHESAVIVGRLWRSIGGNDTYAGNDVFGLSLDAHYAFQKAGSILETGD